MEKHIKNNNKNILGNVITNIQETLHKCLTNQEQHRKIYPALCAEMHKGRKISKNKGKNIFELNQSASEKSFLYSGEIMRNRTMKSEGGTFHFHISYICVMRRRRYL